MPDTPSSFQLWLEEALTGWILPVAALGAAGVGALLYMAGWLGEEGAGALLVLLVAGGTAYWMVRNALAVHDAPRGWTWAAAAATFLAVVLPALPTVRPGAPVFEGDLGGQGQAMPIPAEAAGRLRLLVAGRLREGDERAATFSLAGPSPEVEGRIERTYGYARVGRGTRTRVAHDHVADWYDARVPEGTRELSLRKLTGQLGSRLHVSGYRPLLPTPVGPWVLAALALGVAAVAEARLGRKNAVAVPAAMALGFGLLVTFNATPAQAAGPAIGALLLGAASGALAGWLAGALARRLLARKEA